jgi:cation diffusion facilitator CzcD-associated flavoprotein CzcO
MPRSVSVTIVGAGFGGVAAAIALKRQGVEDLVLLERGDDVGGVWRANTYPGIACDVPSHLYSFSFAPNPRWSRRFSPGSEIRAYLNSVVDRFDVRRHVRLGQNVTGAEFDEGIGRWQVATASGETFETDVLIAACGQLQRPALPALPGLDRFAGRAFHSADWDHDFDPEGARVAAVGTGASAIQFVPQVAPLARHTTVFQRSAPWVIPKNDGPYSERKQRLYERLPLLQRAAREVNWAYFEAIVPVFTQTPPRAARITTGVSVAIATATRMIALRGDRELMRATRPTDPFGCKRILLSSDWYPTLRRDDVSVVTAPIREIVPEGIVTDDGALHPADAIVFGTGFRATDFLAPMEVVGRGGVALAQAWADGAEAFLGLAVPSFPNMFLLYGPNTNHGTGSVLQMHEAQATYIAEAVGLLRSNGAQSIEVRGEVHAAFQAELAERLERSIWGGCSNWYRTASGRITNNWPGSQREYRRRTSRVEAADYVLGAGRPEAVRA